MTPLAFVMLLVCYAAWFVGAGALLYGARHFLPMLTAHRRGGERHEGYAKKALQGFGIFVVACGIAFAAGAAAEFWAGGWGL